MRQTSRRLAVIASILLGFLAGAIVVPPAWAAFTDDTYLGIQYILNGTGTLTVPANVTDTLMGRATTDSVSNKTVPVASNSITSTASRAAEFDGSGNLTASTNVTTTELGYVDGVTSAIQTQLNAKQALDATLTALAGYNTNGLLTQTSPDSFAGRSVVGTSGQITVTNGDGVSGNPTLSLPNYVYFRRQFGATDFDDPATSDWPVTVAAELTTDSTNSGLPVRRFDDTTEEGVGFDVFLPTGSVSLVFRIIYRAQTAPGGTVGVQPSLRVRETTIDSTVEAWAETDMTALSIGTDANWHYASQTISLSTLSLNAGQKAHFELTRQPADGDDTLVGDWVVQDIVLEVIP